MPGLSVNFEEVDKGTSRFDMSFYLGETNEGLKGAITYSTDLFEEATIARMVGHYRVLLEGIVANPDRHLLELPLATEAERHQVLVEWNNTWAEYPRDLCIHQLFEAQVEQTPEALAIACAGEQVTYRELDQRANQLGHYLQGLGVGPETLVGIRVERSVDMVVGMLGILKAGGAYVPFDPKDSGGRLTFMLEDAQASVLLTQAHLLEKLPGHSANLVCLDTDREIIEGERVEKPISSATPDNLAYVIYTSGSTGWPKGVAIEHRNTVAFLDWARRTFSPVDLAGVLASTSRCLSCLPPLAQGVKS